MYAPLHVHTEHSALDGLARLDKLSAAAKDRGIEAMAITDHGSLAGVWDWDKACTKHGIKSIPGIEAYLAIGSRHQKNVVEELNDEGMGDADDDGKGETRSKKYHHLTLLAYNRQGWHNLIRLHNESQKFVWFKPRMDYELIGEYSEGLIATTGCLASPVNSPLKQIDLVGVVKMREHHSHLTSFLDTSDEEVYQQGQEEIIAYIDPLVDGWPESPGQDLRARVTLSADINPDDFDEAVNDAVGDMVDASLQRDKLWQTACDEVESLIDALGAENVYIELMNHGIEAEAAVTGYLHALSEEYGLTCVVTGDSHYIEPNDSEAHEAFLAVGTGATLADEKRFKFNGGGYHLKTYEEMCQGWEPVVEYLGIDDEEEARAWEQWWHQAVDNTMLIADRVTDDVVPEPKMRLPKFPVEEMVADNAADELRLRVERGVASETRYGQNWQNDHELVERIEHELKVITDMGFADYFLITQDVVDWCRTTNSPICTDDHPRGEPEARTPIVTGAGRGSAAGSVVSYCLGIVTVEPLEPGLLFERFLEPGREGMPDIDIDFPASRRDEVFEYLQYRWGHDHTARIGSATVAKTKAAIKDAARVLKPKDSRDSRAVYELGEKMSNAVPIDGVTPVPFSAMDADRQRAHEYFEIIENSDLEVTIEVIGEEMVVDVATQIDAWARSFEEITKSPGIHPCGFVVSDEPLDDLIPLRQQKEGPQIACFDGDTLEGMGFLKMDILGLENLDYLSTAFNIIEKTTGDRLTIDELPYGDEFITDEDGYLLTDEDDFPVYTDEGISRAFGLVAEGRNAGLFQLESEGITQLGREVIPQDKNDLSAIIALYRPGPMGADMHHTYARRKNGLEEIDYSALTSDPEEEEWLSSVLGDTYGLAIYQETAMRLGQVIAGFDDKQRSVLRKAIGKKKQDLMDQCYTWWIQGAPEEHINDRGETVSPVFSVETAENVWEFIKAASSYAFNLAHSYAYGHIAFHTAYLKQAYPAEYVAAVLAHAQKDEKRLATLNSLSDEGIEVAPPDINVSDVNTTARDGVVYYGLGEIKRVGKAAKAIVEQRPEGGYTSLGLLSEVRVSGRKLTKTHKLALIDAGALDSIDDRDELHRQVIGAIDYGAADMNYEDIGAQELKRLKGRWVVETKRGKGEDRTTERTPISYSPLARAGRQLAVLGIVLGQNPLDLLDETHLETIRQDVGEKKLSGDDRPPRPHEEPPTINKEAGGVPVSRLAHAAERGNVRVLGMVTSSQVKSTRKGEKMAFLELLDGLRRLNVIVFPSTVKQKGVNNLPDKGELAVVEGNIQEESGDVRMLTSHLWSVTDPLDQPAKNPEKTAEKGTKNPSNSQPKPHRNRSAKEKSSEPSNDEDSRTKSRMLRKI